MANAKDWLAIEVMHLDRQQGINGSSHHFDIVPIYLGRHRFSTRISLYPAQSEAIESTIRKAHDAVIQEVLDAERGNEVHLDSRDSDEVFARLETLFHNRVGEPMNPKN